MTEAASVEAAVAVHARRAPGRAAVLDADRTLTYAQLDAAVDRLATALAARCVGPGRLVAMHVRRSSDAIALLLAVNRAGGAFLPLDPDYPAERLAYMLSDSGADIVVTDAEASGTASGLALSELLAAPAPASRFAPPPAAPAALAYVIYTSGSTGRSKGVMVDHAAMMHFARTAPREYGLRADDRVLQFFPLSFDGAVEEICTTLTHGATLVLKDAAMTASFRAFEAAAAEQVLTVLHLPPAFWHSWCEYRASGRCAPLPQLRTVLLGGERLRPEAIRTWAADDGHAAQVVNVYGATEAAMFTTLAPLTVAEPFDQRVGRPMPGTTVHVLDPHLAPVGSGAVGEAYIGGRGVGLGYLRRPGVTAAAFVPDPFAADGSRMYRTGDLLRRETDGDLAFAGRVDWQVKIRGFRVEPDEVAQALAGHEHVADAVVLAREDTSGTAELVAFAVRRADTDVTGQQLRAFGAAHLPAFMVPAEVVVVDRLPIAAGGKVDRAALLALATRPAAHRDDRAPLETLWAEAIGGAPVADGATFVESGGTSLRAMWLAGQIERTYDVHLSAVDLLDWTLRQLITQVRRAPVGSPSARSIEPVQEVLPYVEARSLSDAELRRRFEELFGTPSDD